MSPDEPGLIEKPTRVRWTVFSLAFGTSWLLYLHRYAFAFIMPALKEEWDLSKSELGLIDSAFSLSYALFQFPLGIATDALGVRLILPVLIVVWCVGLALQAWVPGVLGLKLARGTFGLGQSAVFANVNRMSQSWFPYSIRTTLQGLVGVLAGRLGGMSAALIFGYLLLGVFGLDWRTAVYLLAGVGILHAILIRVYYRNNPQEHPQVNAAELAIFENDSGGAAVNSTAPKMTVRELFAALKPRAIFNLIALNTASILSTVADTIYSTWIPLFLFEVYAMNYKEMGMMSALPLAGGALGGFAGGVLNDWLIRKTGNRRWMRSGVAFAGKGMAAVLIFTALFWFESPWIFCSMLFFVKFFGDWSLTTSWGIITDIGGRATASVFAFNNSVAASGAVLAPIIFGFIAQHYGWFTVFVVAGCVYVLCSLTWLVVNCTIPMIEEEGP